MQVGLIPSVPPQLLMKMMMMLQLRGLSTELTHFNRIELCDTDRIDLQRHCSKQRWTEHVQISDLVCKKCCVYMFCMKPGVIEMDEVGLRTTEGSLPAQGSA